jgi:hypothetical protein
MHIYDVFFLKERPDQVFFKHSGGHLKSNIAYKKKNTMYFSESQKMAISVHPHKMA